MAGRVRLRVGNILTEAKETISLLGGAGITLTVNDETGGHDQAEVTITADNSPGGVQQALAAHVAAADPHTQYQKESELNAANGYAGLDGSAKVAAANLPTLDAIAAPVADVAMNSQKITGLAAPVSGGDAVNKTYADATAAGLYPHDACTVATTANITLSGAQTIDGISVVATNRVLVKDQTTTKDNGIYVCAAGAWSRSTDADTGAEIKGGSFVYILSGTTNGGKGFAATHVGTPNLGTDPITFSQFSGTTGTPSGPAGGVLGGTYPNPTQGSLALTADLAAYQPTSGKGVSAGYPGAELTINAQTGTAYTLVLTDSLKVVSMSNVAANTVTVPPNASVAFPVGTRLVVKMTSTGQTTLVAGAGVTINTSAGTLALTGQYSYTTLVKTATNTWDAVGGLGSGSGSSGIPASTVTNKGDMLAASGVATVTNVAVGTDGKVLTADSTAGAGVSWQTPAAAGAGIPAATVTTKGDLIAATANATVARKPIGLDGTILTADASQATGMRWGSGGGSAVTWTKLTNAASAGATTLTLDPVPSVLANAGGTILIGVGLNTCDYKGVTTANVSGNTVTVSALTQAHSAGETVAVIQGPIPASWIGCVGGNTSGAAIRNAAALNRFTNFTGIGTAAGGSVIGLDGTYYINDMVVLQGGHTRLTSMSGINTGGGLVAYSTFPFAADFGIQMLAVCDQSGNVATIKNGLGADIAIWLDDFFLDGGGIANSVCLAHSPQQPGHAVNLRFRFGDYGYVFGAQNYWDVRNLQVDQCHIGLVDSHTISAIYNYNFTAPTSGSSLALDFEGNHGAVYGGDLETTNGTGPLLTLGGEGLILDGLWTSGIAGGGAGTIFQVDSWQTYASYSVRDFKCNQNASNVKFLRDVDRGFSLNSLDSGGDSPGRYMTAIARNTLNFTTYYGTSGWMTASSGSPHAA